MFRGISQLSLDSKGRFAIPAKYRDALASLCDGRLIVTADPSQCLLIYPQPAWEPIEKKLTDLSSFGDKTRSLQRLLVGYATDVEMDSAGRVLVTSPLHKFAGLKKNVVLVGQGAKFELWDEEQWDQQMEYALGFKDDDMPAELEGFSL